MAKYKAIDIAKWFLYKSLREKEQGDGDNITLLKLLKLLYYAEGCSLAVGNGSLFDEDIIAWEHGPVVPEVYYAYCNDPYNLPFNKNEDMASINKIKPNDENLLNQVYDVFGQYTAWTLREKTHTEKPWLEATESGTVLNRKISRDTMKDYFKEHYVE